MKDEVMIGTLRLALDKWTDIRLHGGVDDGVANCPLCRAYMNGRISGEACKGCPIERRYGTGSCSGSPYAAWARHQVDAHGKEWGKAKGWRRSCRMCDVLADKMARMLEEMLAEAEASEKQEMKE